VKREVDARSIESAITEAKRRVAAAQDAERQAEEARVANELAELEQIMREAGQKADKALKAFITELNNLKKVIVAMQQRGNNTPSAAQLQALGRRALLGQLVDSPLAKEFEHVSPRERQDFAVFTNSWASSVERAINQKLGGDEKVA